MSRRLRIFLITFFISILSFFSFLPSILRNTIPFHTDEMYWIQTARILPYMLEGKFQNSYWKEHMGFTNFNGAKLMYAFGLRFFGHTDFSAIGDPPFHYEIWKKYDGLEFPRDHSLYPLLLHGRLISAFTASIAMGLMFLFVFAVFRNLPAAILSSLLLRIHPIMVTIATHAFADSLFLSYELMILIFVIRMLRSNLALPTSTYFAFGAVLGLGVATKINAAIFYVMVIINGALWSVFRTIPKHRFFRAVFVVTITAQFFFLIIHPNFYFFPQYSLPQMIADRLEITHYHMAYFNSVDPGHVLFTIPQRLNSLWRHVFTPILLPFFMAGIVGSILLFIKRKFWTESSLFFFQWINLLIIGIFLLAYVVFDEQRYFLPILPFASLIASSWMKAMFVYVSSLGRYWRASAR